LNGWDLLDGMPTTPNLGPNWRVVQRSHLPSRADRPTIPIPNMTVLEISVADFKKQFSYRMKSFGVIDFETWRDFTNPNMCSFLFYRSYASTGSTWRRTGMKVKEVDGMIRRGNNGCPLDWEDAPETWKDGIKPKSHGRYHSSDHDTVQVSLGYLWDDEVTAHLPRLIHQAFGGDNAVMDKLPKIYAHNATVDIIALLSILEPDLPHPLMHFTSNSQEDKARMLFKGSSILNAQFDLAPYLENFEGRRKFNRRSRKWEVFEDRPIEIRDSMALLPLPLAKLGAACGYPKTDTPEIFWNGDHPDFGNYMAITPDMVRYAIDDCVIVWKSLLEMWCMVKELDYHGKEMTLTIGSLAFQMNSDNIAKNGGHIVKKKERRVKGRTVQDWKYHTVVPREDLDSIMRDALTGGMVRVFTDEAFVGPSFGIDARSLYPSVMTHPESVWPDATQLSTVLYDHENDLSFALKSEGAVHVHWSRPDSDKIGAVASRCPDSTNLIWTEYEGTRWITNFQARFLLDRGYTLTPVPFIYEQSKVRVCEDGEATRYIQTDAIWAIRCPALKFNPFEGISKWYDKRIELKEAGDPRQMLCKLLMNTSFGKYVELNTDQRVATEIDWEMNFPDWEFSGVAEIQGEMVGYVTDPTPKRAANTMNILGCYITDMARAELLTMADRFPVEKLAYCDTDSLKVLMPLEEGMKLVPSDKMGRDLRQWAVENEHDFFQAIAPKQYKVHFISKEDSRTGELVECDAWKIRIKGVNMRGVIEKMWLEEFKTGRPTDDFTYAVLKDLQLHDKMKYDRVIGLRESLRRGVVAGEWTEQEKQLRTR